MEHTDERESDKRKTVEYIQKHIRDYRFPWGKKKLRRKIKSFKGENADNIYEDFFKNFHNNVYFCLFGVKHPKSKITCDNYNGYFIPDQNTGIYIPLNDRKEDPDSELSETWGEFCQLVRGNISTYNVYVEDHDTYRKNIRIISISLLFLAVCIWGSMKFDKTETMAVALLFSIVMVAVAVVVFWIGNILLKDDYYKFIKQILSIQSPPEVKEFGTLWRTGRRRKIVIDSMNSFLKKRHKHREYLDNVFDKIGSSVSQRTIADSVRRFFHSPIVVLCVSVVALAVIVVKAIPNIHIPRLSGIDFIAREKSMKPEEVTQPDISTELKDSDVLPTESKDPDVLPTESKDPDVPTESEIPAIPVASEETVEAETKYVIAANEAMLMSDPDTHSTILGELHYGDEISVSDKQGIQSRSIWYKVSDGEISGWVKRTQINVILPNKAPIIAAKLSDGTILGTELYDGYLESFWEVPKEVVEQEQEITFTLDENSFIKGIYIYNGNYKDNDYYRYGKVTEIAVRLDNGEEEIDKISAAYDLNGCFIPLSGMAKEITIRPLKIQPGLDEKESIRKTACISEVIVIKDSYNK